MCACAGLATRLAAQDDAGLHFAGKVYPVLQARCLSCHGNGPDGPKGGLDLRTRGALLKGGESMRPSVVPEEPDKSPLYIAVTREHPERWAAMPPKENDRLHRDQIDAIRRWIADGAPWPGEPRLSLLVERALDAQGIKVHTSGGLSPEWTQRRYKPEGLWAYRPIDRRDAPAGASNPVDAFIDRKLASVGLKPAPPADRRTLIRRASFDLLGLPPTPEEIDAFATDPAPDGDAWARLVDRLLASPHYGEQMARHWLDVARYADSSGFANDFARGNAWRYRDYVIRSFNADKPYDRFVREQIAGDEIAPDDPEMRVAVGFLRMGPWELTAMEVPRIARQRFLDDVVNSVGETFLAHSLQCARCHDHKFDPVPTRDFYSMQAVFATTQLAEREAPFLPAENTSGFEERAYLERRRESYASALRALDEKSLAASEAWFAQKGIDPTGWRAAVAEAGAHPGKAPHRQHAVFEGARALMLKRGIPEDRFPPQRHGLSGEDIGLQRIAQKGIERLVWEFDRYEPRAFSVYSGRTPELTAVTAPLRVPANAMTQGELEQVAILAGGDPFSPTEKVQPGALSAIGALRAPIPNDIRGRRRALAEWTTDPGNPLTSRVMVNRIWGWLFGQHLAGNPNNFGSTGKPPTHPELLDWLAGEFSANGWSVKSLQRLIVTSETYRRTAAHPDPKALADRDPGGACYAAFRPRRLAAEELRDATLRVSGELNPALGGIPVRPEINIEVAHQPRQVMGTFAEAWQPSPLPEQRNRRSLYALKLRGLRDPYMEVFNQPPPDLSCENRDASTVTPQVFSLFNSRASLSRALALAQRLKRETGSPATAIDRAFALAYGRSPTGPERTECLDHWRAMVERHATLEFPRAQPARELVREAVEENTGQRFVFREPLESAPDFVPDPQHADADPGTRALADVCLVLLNSNEFAYRY
ncbi:MAG: PSD1 domain-containing protein, partial [Verrucomicrobiae bacterium]|nr:PSD1 domain-containing protein [Verrucomicrobiae bacterium]